MNRGLICMVKKSKEKLAEFSKDQIEAVVIDEDGFLGYEFMERLAILEQNNPGMHPVHAHNKARKEIKIRILRQRQAS